MDEVEGMYPLRGSERHIGDRAFQGWALAEIRIPHPSVKAKELLAPFKLVPRQGFLISELKRSSCWLLQINPEIRISHSRVEGAAGSFK